MTDKLRSYGVAHRELIPESIHSTKQYENNRAEQSHEATRISQRGMRKFKSGMQGQRFFGAQRESFRRVGKGGCLIATGWTYLASTT